jgi:arabinogalactan oligomer/maltooligosaccharide transport system substrate-binding protein
MVCDLVGLRSRVVLLVAVAGAAVVAGCDDAAPRPDGARLRLRLWHTFSPRETEVLNAELARRDRAGTDGVEPTLLPFSRAQRILGESLRDGGGDCPDLARIDATWLPGLARAGLLLPVPPNRAASQPAWLPEARELASDGDVQYGIPQAIDGLALLYNVELVRRAGVAWPPHTVNELIATAHRLTIDGAYGLSVRVDGYWFVAFLRAWGGAVADPESGALGIDAAIAARSLARFAELFAPGGVVPPPPPPGEEAPTERRLFTAGRVAIAVDGPWAVAELRGGDVRLGVAPFPVDARGRPAAPLGGQLFVVPRCARDPDGAWRLALDLTAPSLQAEWARDLGIIPTTEAGLAVAGEFVRDFRQALLGARPLPRHPVTTELFDDLTPAVAAVVAGDATADEALAGVTRAWTRILARHGILARSTADTGAGAQP